MSWRLTRQGFQLRREVPRRGVDLLFFSASRKVLVGAITAEIADGLVFHLRFVHGTRGGRPAPENNALMFTVQVDFPDETGKVRPGVRVDGNDLDPA